MEHQISRIDPLQAGKIAAALYFVVGLITTPISLIGNYPFQDGEWGVSFLLVFLLPLIYALLGFIIIPAICWLYNRIANRIGGLKISLISPPESRQDQEL